MRLARKLFLFVALAVAAVAFAAPSAFGQIEVMDEVSGLHCGDVTVTGHEATGDCEISAHSVDSPHLPPAFGDGVLLSAGGTTLSICETEFEGYAAEDGSGLITHQDLVDVAGLGNSCQVEPCKEANMGQEPWPAQLTEPSAGVEELIVVFCITGIEGEGTPCEFTREVVATGHAGILEAEDAECHGYNPAEVTGAWENEELETNAEVTHSTP